MLMEKDTVWFETDPTVYEMGERPCKIDCVNSEKVV